MKLIMKLMFRILLQNMEAQKWLTNLGFFCIGYLCFILGPLPATTGFTVICDCCELLQQSIGAVRLDCIYLHVVYQCTFYNAINFLQSFTFTIVLFVNTLKSTLTILRIHPCCKANCFNASNNQPPAIQLVLHKAMYITLYI